MGWLPIMNSVNELALNHNYEVNIQMRTPFWQLSQVFDFRR